MNYNRMLAMVLGWVLLVVGLLGFVSPLTQSVSAPFTGVPAPRLLGIFEVNGLHNVVHVLSGAFLLAGAYMMGGANARMANMVLGAVYLVVFLVGALVAPLSDLIAIDAADNGLHLVLGIVLLAVPFMMKDDAKMGMGNKPAM